METEMLDILLRRKLLLKLNGDLSRVSIYVTRPLPNDGLFVSKIIFDNVPKYNTDVSGIDEFHAVECAIAYINGICRNSTDPEFLHLNGDSILIG